MLTPNFFFLSKSIDLISSYREGALLIWRNRPIFLIGLVQVRFQSRRLYSIGI
jgi:hypothetical protein